jgi:hypothetical protein
LALLRKKTGLGVERRRKREIPSPVGSVYKPIPLLPKNVHIPIKSKDLADNSGNSGKKYDKTPVCA